MTYGHTPTPVSNREIAAAFREQFEARARHLKWETDRLCMAINTTADPDGRYMANLECRTALRRMRDEIDATLARVEGIEEMVEAAE